MLKKTSYLLSSEDSQRINIIKLISIILVVYIHSYNLETSYSDSNINFILSDWLVFFEKFLSHGIASMAVPTFFCISAILLFKKEHHYGKLLQKKTVSLLIPYFFWNSIWILIFFLLQTFDFTRPYFSHPNNIIANFKLHDWLSAYGLTFEGHPLVFPLWFMRDLMLMIAAYPLLKFTLNSFPKVIFALLLVLLSIPSLIYFQGPLTYFLLGGCIVKFNLHMKLLDKIPFLLVGLIYFISLIFKIQLNIHIITSINILLGMIFIIKLSKFIYKSRKLAFLFSKLIPYAFIIYVGHELIFSSLERLLYRYLPHSNYTLLTMYITLPMFIILICIFIENILKKYTPLLHSLATGSRG